MLQTVLEKLTTGRRKKSINSGITFFHRKAVQQTILRQEHYAAFKEQEDRFRSGFCGQ